jgi:hypothetical protein
MPRFSLRTLIVVMLLGGPLLAFLWIAWQEARDYMDRSYPPQNIQYFAPTPRR